MAGYVKPPEGEDNYVVIGTIPHSMMPYKESRGFPGQDYVRQLRSAARVAASYERDVVPGCECIDGWLSPDHRCGGSAEPELMAAVRWELTRDLVPGEPGYYGERLMCTGETVYWYNGNTTGHQPLKTGMFVSEFGPNAYPYFEIPKDAAKVADVQRAD